MNSASVLVIYQHLQRNANLVAGNMRMKSLDLRNLVNLSVVAVVDDGDVAFLIGGRRRSTTDHIAQALLQYAESHELRYHLFTNERRSVRAGQE